MLDLIVDRREMKASLARVLRFMRAEPVPQAEPQAAASMNTGQPG
jgi:acetyl-CoA carboxylase beta subunit